MPSNKKLHFASDANRQAMNWLILGGSLVSLSFWSNLNDPFNAPKSWILSIAGFWLLPWVIFQVKGRWEQKPLKLAIIFAISYLFTMSLGLLVTDDKFIGIFGDYQRRTGYLSYFCLITFFLAASFLIDLKRLATLDNATLIVGFLVGIYGFAQHFKYDFIQWNNPYNSVLSSVGNPDFASALMAIFSVLNFGILIQQKYAKWMRVIAGINTFLLLVVIVFSQARQGLVAAFIGITIILIVWIHQRNRFAGFSAGGIAIVAGALGLIGMLNMGPLAKYFYKISVTYRGDYWRAGWRMFIHRPFFGVGLDRYGANFRQFRDTTQVVRRGPDLVSNAAHDVPIQLASTGGIFVLIAFLALTGFVLWRGIVGIRKTAGAEQITITVIFAAWVAYEGQSLISIDNLGIAIWGYILGGAVVGISLSSEAVNAKQVKDWIVQPLISSVLALSLLVISLLFLQAETAMKTLISTQPPGAQTDLAAYESIAQKPLSYTFKEPSFAVAIAGELGQVRDFGLATGILQRTIAANPRSYDAMNILSQIYEDQKNWQGAYEIRQEMVKLDPFNHALRVQLDQDQKNKVIRTP
jgi:O-antigen ligase